MELFLYVFQFTVLGRIPEPEGNVSMVMGSKTFYFIEIFYEMF